MPALATRTIGALTVTEVGLGGAQFGNLYREHSDADAEAIFTAAWDAGIRYVDTAPHYGLGLSERRLGSLLRGIPRDEFVLSTKVGRLLVPGPDGDRLDEPFIVPATLARQWDFSADGVRRSLEESLERLGLDRVDIVYLHDPEDHWRQALDEALPALIEMRDAGVIRAVGAGMNFSDKLTELIEGYDVDVVMCAGRYTAFEADQRLVDAAAARGAKVVAAGIYNSGLLARERPAPDANYNYAPATPQVLARVNALADLCESHGVTLPQVAVNYPLRNPAVASVDVGMSSPAQVQTTMDNYHARIPEALWDDLDAFHLEAGPTP